MYHHGAAHKSSFHFTLLDFTWMFSLNSCTVLDAMRLPICTSTKFMPPGVSAAKNGFFFFHEGRELDRDTRQTTNAKKSQREKLPPLLRGRQKTHTTTSKPSDPFKT